MALRDVDGIPVYKHGQLEIWECPVCHCWRDIDERTCRICRTPRKVFPGEAAPGPPRNSHAERRSRSASYAAAFRAAEVDLGKVRKDPPTPKEPRGEARR